MRWLFYQIAELLGVRLFKRYWPVNGSYWNEIHCQKNSISDLKEIQRKTKEYTRQHVQTTAILSLICLLSYLFNISNFDIRCYFYLCLPIECYAFMVQLYNYWKADDALSQIKSNPVSNPDQRSLLDLSNQDQPIQISVCDAKYFKCRSFGSFEYNGPTLYRWCLYGANVYSPYFESLDACLAFRDRIYLEYGNRFVDLLNQLTVEKVNELYRDIPK